MTSNRRARIRPVWVPAMPLAILLMEAALAACSGESSGSDAPATCPYPGKRNPGTTTPSAPGMGTP